jgi:hypothetical protein
MTKGMNTEASNRKQPNIAKAKTASADGMNLRSGKLLEGKSVGAETKIKMEEE